MPRVLKILLASVTALLVLVADAVLLVIYKPALVVNVRTVTWAAQVATKYGVEVSWRAATIDATSQSFWRKELTVGFEGLCVKVDSPHVDGCFDKVGARLQAHLAPSALRVVEVGPVTIVGGPLTVVVPSASPEPTAEGVAPEPAASMALPRFLAETILHPVSVRLTGLHADVAGVAVSAAAVELLIEQTAGSVHAKIVGKAVCGTPGALKIDGCLADLSAEATVTAPNGMLRVAEVGPLTVVGGPLVVALPPSPPDPAAPPLDLLHLELPKVLADTTLRPLSVQLAGMSVDVAGVAASAGNVDVLVEQTAGAVHAKLVGKHICGSPSVLKIDGCLADFSAEATVTAPDGYLRLAEVGPLTVVGGPLAVKVPPPPLPPAPEPEAAEADWRQPELPLFLASTTLHPVSVRLTGLSLDVGGLAATAGRAELRVEQAGGAVHATFSGRTLCGNPPGVKIDGCIATWSAEATATAPGGLLQITDVGPLTVESAAIAVALPPAVPDADPPVAPNAHPPVAPGAKADEPYSFALPPWLAGATVHPLTVRVGGWKVAQPRGFSAHGKADLTIAADGDAVRAEIDLGAPCADLVKPKSHACFNEARIGASLRQRDGNVKLAAFGPVTVTGGDVRADLVTEPAAAAAKAAPGGQIEGPTLIPAFLSGARLKPVRIELARLIVRQDGAPLLAASATIDGRVTQKLAQWAVSGDARLTQKGAPARAVKAALAATQDESAAIDFHGDVSLEQAGASVAAKASGKLVDARLAARLEATALGFVPRVPRVDARNCTLDLTGIATDSKETAGTVRCDVVMTPERFAFQDDMPIKLPPEATIHIEGRGKSGLPPSARRPLDATVTAKLQPFAMREVQASAEVSAVAKGTFVDMPRTMSLGIDGAVKIAVARFEDLVQALQPSRFAIPAPLNVLAGSVEASVSAHGDPFSAAGLEMPIRAISRLRSPEQSLDTDTNGLVRLSTTDEGMAADVEVQASLSDVQLALPDLTIASRPPQLVPDKRIERAAAATEMPAKASVTYKIDVTTPADKPARLVSNMALKPIPLAINYHLQSGVPGQGGIMVDEFPLNLFRRDAKVEHFRVQLQGPEEPALLDGLLRVSYTDYTINIAILGTSSAPIVQLYSDPPRPERELAAILLFGKDMNDLDEDQLKSAESFRAAAADGALSLASMYLLASTPVESVGYDPVAKAFTAKVSLGKGTSLNLGSDFDGYQKVGIRRRLSGSWSVETFGEYKQETDERSATALLEWSKRY